MSARGSVCCCGNIDDCAECSSRSSLAKMRELGWCGPPKPPACAVCAWCDGDGFVEHGHIVGNEVVEDLVPCSCQRKPAKPTHESAAIHAPPYDGVPQGSVPLPHHEGAVHQIDPLIIETADRVATLTRERDEARGGAKSADTALGVACAELAEARREIADMQTKLTEAFDSEVRTEGRLIAAEACVSTLRTTLRRIRAWDILNPSEESTYMLADADWLRALVDDALKAGAKW